MPSSASLIEDSPWPARLDAGLEQALLDGLSEGFPVSSGDRRSPSSVNDHDPGAAVQEEFPDVEGEGEARDAALPPAAAEAPHDGNFSPQIEARISPGDEDTGYSAASLGDPGALPPATGAGLEQALLDGLSEGFPVSSGDQRLPPSVEDHDLGAALREALPDVEGEGEARDAALESATAKAPHDGDPGSQIEARISLNKEDTGYSAASLGDSGALPPATGAGFEQALAEGLSCGPFAALAFATDSVTEDAFREGLIGYEGHSAGHEEPQVWGGGLRAAAAALADGYSAPLVFVDMDGISYPAGAVHELAAVCEVGTAVIAVGSDDTVQAARDLLLAGVSEYMTKPLTAAAVREAAVRVTAPVEHAPAVGRVAGFAGTGGSGSTTLATGAAIHAANKGHYVSVLDLNREVPAAALLLDVEPAPGLDQLLELAGRSPEASDLLEKVRSRRSERIAVYAHRNVFPEAPASRPAALGWLLAQLRRRSQLVVVDGIHDPALRSCLPAEIDTWVFVAEPDPAGSGRAARFAESLGDAAPVLFVENHTRASGRGRRALHGAGPGFRPDIVVPCEPSLPAIADRGWPRDKLPRSLRRPLTELVNNLLAPVSSGASRLSASP